MIRLSTTVVRNLIPQVSKKIQSKLQALPKQVHTEFVKQTPIDTGNARRKTRLIGDTIHARYPYARRLDKGWSKQAPDGMIKPTRLWMRKRIQQILRNK